MSEPLRIALVGATGLVGRHAIAEAAAHDAIGLVGVARREMRMAPGVKMEMVLADPAKWGDALAAIGPTVLICALGTTWKQAGRDEARFRAVDQQLVLDAARAALAAGAERMIAISSVGADPKARSFYLRVKGEVEQELARLGFRRLDILRPGLLKGPRDGDRRPGETLAKLVSPLLDPLLGGKWRAYRSIEGRVVAQAALELASRKAAGRFIHDNDAIRRAARDWERRAQ